MVGFEFTTFIPPRSLMYPHVAQMSRTFFNKSSEPLEPESIQKIMFFEKTAPFIPLVFRVSYPQFFTCLWVSFPPPIIDR